MTRTLDQTTSVGAELEDACRDLLLGSWSGLSGDYAIQRGRIAGWSHRARPDASCTRWPVAGGPQRAASIQMGPSAVAWLISSIYAFSFRQAGGAETQGPFAWGGPLTGSAVAAAVGALSRESAEQRAQQLILAAFADLDEVTAIYVQRYREELQVTVLLGIGTYDDEVMGKVLDREYDVQKAIARPVASFSYVPKVYVNRRDIVHPGAKLIYER